MGKGLLIKRLPVMFKHIYYCPAPLKGFVQAIFAAFLFGLPVAWRKQLFAGQAYYCPICQSRLSHFPALIRPQFRWCPICQSVQRHRFGWVFLTSLQSQNRPMQGRFLHVSPEPALAARLAKFPGLVYLTADLADPRAMIQADLCALPFPDGWFDWLYCSHVLEHIVDDHLAIDEMARVLKSAGSAIVQVPLSCGSTFRDPTITRPAERQKQYGQHDHVRRYGDDFSERLSQAGFQVNCVQPGDLLEITQAQQMGLEPTDKIFHCRKAP